MNRTQTRIFLEIFSDSEDSDNDIDNAHDGTRMQISLGKFGRGRFEPAMLEEIIRVTMSERGCSEFHTLFFACESEDDDHYYCDIWQYKYRENPPLSICAQVYVEQCACCVFSNNIAQEYDGLYHEHTSQLKHKFKHHHRKICPGPPARYVAFSAAYDGCLFCVQRLWKLGCVELTERSDSGATSLYDYAAWGYKYHHRKEVVEFLHKHIPAHSRQAKIKMEGVSRGEMFAATSVAAMTMSRSGSAHIALPHQHTSQAKGCRNYLDPLLGVAFSAAFDGCKTCVELLVEGHGLRPDASNGPFSFTMFEFAQLGCQLNPGQSHEVMNYLDGLVLPPDSPASSIGNDFDFWPEP